MSDITMCTNTECIKRNVCKRVLVVPNKLRQSYSKFKPINNSQEKFKCDYFKL